MDFLVIAFMEIAVPFKVSKRNYCCLYSIERCLEYCNYYIDVLRGILAISSSINAMLLMMTFSYQYLPLFISQEARDDDGFPFRRITLRCHHWMCLLQALVEDDVFNGRSDKIQRTFLLWCWFKIICCGFVVNKTSNWYWFLNNDVTTYVFTNDVSLQCLPRYLK